MLGITKSCVLFNAGPSLKQLFFSKYAPTNATIYKSIGHGEQLQKNVMEKIGVLFGLKTLSVHIGHLHEYSIFSDPHHSRFTNFIIASTIHNFQNIV